jgi:hypothetical protein
MTELMFQQYRKGFIMSKITKEQYEFALARIEELLLRIIGRKGEKWNWSCFVVSH